VCAGMQEDNIARRALAQGLNDYTYSGSTSQQCERGVGGHTCGVVCAGMQEDNISRLALAEVL